MVALLFGSAILLFSCKQKPVVAEEYLDGVKTEESHDLTLIMSENGRKSYVFTSPLLEGYMLGRDPYREFRKGISITTYQDDSLTKENAVLVANYAIYYDKRKLWEAKGDVVITKHDGTKLYTQQLFWNSVTKRIYSNVDTKLVSATDEVIGEGFESDEEMNEPRFRRWKGRMQVDMEQLRKEQQESSSSSEVEPVEKEPEEESKSDGEELFPGEPVFGDKAKKSEEPKPATQQKPEAKPIPKPTPQSVQKPTPQPVQKPTPQTPQKPGQRPVPPALQRGPRPQMPPHMQNGGNKPASPQMQQRKLAPAQSQTSTK